MTDKQPPAAQPVAWFQTHNGVYMHISPDAAGEEGTFPLYAHPDPRIAKLERDLAAALAERDEAIRAAVAAEREAIASEMDCGCDCRDAVLETLRTEGRRKARYQCKFSLECLALQADEIRARGAAHD